MLTCRNLTRSLKERLKYIFIKEISNISLKSFRLQCALLSYLTYQDLMKCTMFRIVLTHLPFSLFSVLAEVSTGFFLCACFSVLTGWEIIVYLNQDNDYWCLLKTGSDQLLQFILRHSVSSETNFDHDTGRFFCYQLVARWSHFEYNSINARRRTIKCSLYLCQGRRENQQPQLMLSGQGEMSTFFLQQALYKNST